MSAAERLVLAPLAGAADWKAFHALRKAVLFDARGRGGSYDFRHKDDRAPTNLPLLLRRGDEPVGAMRIDFLDGGRAAFRTVAIRADCQRQGYGLRMLALAADLAWARGCRHVLVNAAGDAVDFYRRFGFRPETWPDAYGNVPGVVQMGIELGASAP